MGLQDKLKLTNSGTYRVILTISLLLLTLCFTTTSLAQESNPDFERGLSLYEAGDLDGAEAAFDAARDTYLAANDRLGEANALYQLGLIIFDREQYVDARNLYFNPALTRFREENATEGSANALRYIAKSNTEVGRYEEAIGLYGSALTEARNADLSGLAADILTDRADNNVRASDERRSADNLNQQPDSLIRSEVDTAENELERAIADYVQAAELYLSITEIEDYAETLVLRADAHAKLYNTRSAILDLDDAIIQFSGLGLDQRQADVLFTRAEILAYTGEYEEAATTLQRADELFLQLGDDTGHNRALALQGYIAFRQDFPGAQQAMNEALSAQRLSGDSTGRMITLRYLGEYNLITGDPNVARNQFDESLSIAQNEADLQAEAWGFFGRGLAKARGNLDLRDALNDIDFGMSRFRDYLRDVRSLRYINNLQAQFFLSRREYADSVGGEGAILLLQDSLNRAREVNDISGQAESNVQLGDAYVIMARDQESQQARQYTDWGDYNPAIIYYRTAADLYARDLDFREQGYAYLRIGELQRLTGRIEQSDDTYDLALAAFLAAEYPIGHTQTLIRQAYNAYLLGNEIDTYNTLLEAETILASETNPLLQDTIDLTQADIQMHLGMLYIDSNQFNLAEQVLNEARTTQSIAGSSQQFLTSAYLGNLQLTQGDFSSARSTFDQILSQSRNPRANAIAARGRGIIEGNESSIIAMQQFFEDALVQSRRIHDIVGEINTFMAQGYVYLELGDLENAQAQFSSAEGKAIGVNSPNARAIAEFGQMRAYIADYEDANRIGIAVPKARDAIFHANQTGDILLQIEVNRELGDMYLAVSSYDDALEAYNDARELALQQGYLLRESTINSRIASIFLQRRQFTLGLNILSDTETRLNCLLGNSIDFDCSSFTINTENLNPLFDDNNVEIILGVVQRQFGEIYIELEQYSIAEQRLQTAENTLSGYAQDYIQADIELSYTLSAQGQLALIQTDYSSATGSFEEALRTANFRGDDTAAAVATYGLGLTYTIDDIASNDNAGLQSLDSAIFAFRSGALNARLLQESFLAKGDYYRRRRDIQQSSTFYYQAINEAQTARDQIGQGLANLQLGDLFLEDFQFGQAERAYEEAERLFDRAQAPLSQAQAFNSLGNLNVQRVRYDDALENYNDMQAIYAGENDALGLARSFNEIGRVEYLQARYARALDSHLSALNTLQVPLAVVNEASTNNEEVTLEQEFFNSLVATTEMLTYRDIARVRLALADFERSESALETAQELAEEADNQRVITDLTLLNGRLLYAKDDLFGAQLEFERAIADYVDRGDELAEGQANIDLGRVMIDLIDRGFGNLTDNVNAATTAYNRAINVGINFDDNLLSTEARLGLGRVYTRSGRDENARDFLSTALRDAQATENEDLLIRTYVELGLFYEKQQNFDTAVSNFVSAIELIEAVHSVMRVQTGQANFFAQNNVPYQRLVEYYIDTGQDELAFEYAERGRSRTFIYHANREQLDFGETASSQTLEQWRSTNTLLADLIDQRNQLLAQQQSDTSADANNAVTQELREVDAQITNLERDVERLQASIEAQETVLSQVVYVNTPTLEEIRQSVAPESVLVAYYVVPAGQTNHIYAFVITSEGYEAVALDDIPNLIGRVYDAVAFKNNVENNGMDQLADVLIGELVENSSSFVQEAMAKPNWIIAPHNALNVMPFTALVQSVVPDSEVYLQYTPSASFYVALQDRLGNVSPISSASSALVFGNPINSYSRIESPPNLPSLAFAREEAMTVAGLFGTTEIVEEDADERVFIEEASRHDVIHIAAHGVIEVDNPLSTYLLLSDDEETGQDGRLEVREIYTLQLQSRSPLVVLSACETNIDNLVDGDEFQGLARAFLVSGARGVVASLWQVDDEATGFLMERFHQYTTSGDHPSVALAKAQADVRNNPDRDWAAPNFWASFVYIGV